MKKRVAQQFLFNILKYELLIFQIGANAMADRALREKENEELQKLMVNSWGSNK